jgi:hypothetical protein
MAHFEDLTTYEYLGTPTSGVLNVGWLGAGQPFNRGTTSEAFQTALRTLCDNKSMNLCFGHHVCEFCPGASWGDPYFFSNGNGEIRVRAAGGTWYVAPRLVLHYVVEHNYCPPPEFVEAVLDPAEIGEDPEPVPLSEDEQVERIRESDRRMRAERGPPITEAELDRIVKRGIRDARSLRPWWRFW